MKKTLQARSTARSTVQALPSWKILKPMHSTAKKGKWRHSSIPHDHFPMLAASRKCSSSPPSHECTTPFAGGTSEKISRCRTRHDTGFVTGSHLGTPHQANGYIDCSTC